MRDYKNPLRTRIRRRVYGKTYSRLSYIRELQGEDFFWSRTHAHTSKAPEFELHDADLQEGFSEFRFCYVR